VARSIFSLEFFSRNGTGALERSLGEYFLTLGPTAYREHFRFRVSVEPTFGGSAVTDFGNDTNQLTLSGEFHLYFAARPPSQSDIGGSVLDAASGADSIAGGASAAASRGLEVAQDAALDFASEIAPVGSLVRRGGLEFFEFLSLLYFVRRPGSTPSGQSGGRILAAIQQLAGDEGARYSEYGLVFHDYGRKRHVEVVVPREGFSISRSVEDTNTYRWELNLAVLGEAREAVYDPPGIFAELRRVNPQYAVARSIATVKALIALPLQVSGVLRSYGQAFSQFQGLGDDLSRAWDNMRRDFAADGRAFSSGFRAIVDLLKSTVGQPEKQSPLERLEATLEERRDRLQELQNRAAEFRRKLLALQERARELLDVSYINLVAPAGTLEEAALEPDADWTHVVEEPAYVTLLEVVFAGVQAEAEFLRAVTDNQFRVVPAPAGGWDEAARIYAGSAGLAAALALYNRAAMQDPAPGNPIRVPFEHLSEIFAEEPPDSGPQDWLRANLGEDLALTAARDFAIAPNGDLDVSEGEESLADAVVDVAETPAGALPAHRWYGQPVDPGELQTTWLKDAYVERFLSALRADPRIRSAEVISRAANGVENRFRIEVESINEHRTSFIV